MGALSFLIVGPTRSAATSVRIMPLGDSSALGAGASTRFGFLGSSTGSNASSVVACRRTP